ncbi:MAG: inositol monophosphatase family protein [Candidatus Hodgkinia cicadicola]
MSRGLLKITNFLLDVTSEAVKNIRWSAQKVERLAEGTEGMIADLVRNLTPDMAFWGKYLGYVNTPSNPSLGTWIMESVCRLEDAIYGWPTWASTLCLIQDDSVTLGALTLPMMGESLIGLNGKTYSKPSNEAPMRPLPRLSDSNIEARDCIVAASASMRKSIAEDCALTILELEVKRVLRDYSFYAISLLVHGKIDAIVECDLSPQVIAAITPILRGVGCIVTDWEGRNVCCSNRIIATRSHSLLRELVTLVGQTSY